MAKRVILIAAIGVSAYLVYRYMKSAKRTASAAEDAAARARESLADVGSAITRTASSLFGASNTTGAT